MTEVISNDKKLQLTKAFCIILENKEIILLKQRIIEILGWFSDNEWIEILSRVWENKVSPEEYLWVIDEDMKVDFDFSVFELILREYKLWKIRFNSIHININPTTLLDLNFKARINKLFQQYWFSDFSKLKFEILENWEITNIELLNFNIWYLRYLWIQVWLDDYPNENNNYELLWLIQELDFVKIDKSFLLSLGIKTPDSIVEEVQKMVDEIRKIHPNVTIIIEGVENEEMYRLVIDKLQWIDGLQGYLFGKPEQI